jgi:hypothetical protein
MASQLFFFTLMIFNVIFFAYGDASQKKKKKKKKNFKKFLCHLFIFCNLEMKYRQKFT